MSNIFDPDDFLTKAGVSLEIGSEQVGGLGLESPPRSQDWLTKAPDGVVGESVLQVPRSGTGPRDASMDTMASSHHSRFLGNGTRAALGGPISNARDVRVVDSGSSSRFFSAGLPSPRASGP